MACFLVGIYLHEIEERRQVPPVSSSGEEQPEAKETHLRGRRDLRL